MADIAVHDVEPQPEHPQHDDHAADGHGGYEDHTPHATSTGLSNNKLAMWLFLGSECLLFGGLISTYMLYRGRHENGPGPDQIFDIPLTSVSSFILLMSSLTMVLAVNSAKRKDERRARMWLTVTALLGALFISGQVYEFTVFYREGLGYTTSLFSSSFYTLTGFHGVHVTLGPLTRQVLQHALDAGHADLRRCDILDEFVLFLRQILEQAALHALLFAGAEAAVAKARETFLDPVCPLFERAICGNAEDLRSVEEG